MAAAAFPTLSAAVLLGLGRSAGDPATRPFTIVMAGLPANDAAQFRATLEAAGHVCLPAATWPEAIATLSRLPADALLQDLACPGARRFEGIRRLRGWPPPLSRLASIALASQQERLAETTCIEAGFDALLTRPLANPLAAGALEATLRRIVASRTPATPLDMAVRDALLEELGAEGRRAQDTLALDRAAALMAQLRTAPALPEVQDAAARIAATFAAVGAPAAAAAASALEAAPERRPALLAPLINAVVAAKMALRRG